MTRLSRRKFLKTTGAAASAAILGPALFQRQALASPAFTRLDVGGLTATSPVIAGYKTAIAAMQALPANDPRSWLYQANIHGTYDSPSQPSWNTCQHGSFFFLSWHRMYLYWFERIVRHYSGVRGWALPYWNYADAAQRQIPSMFRTPTSASQCLRTCSCNPRPSLPRTKAEGRV